MRVVMGLPIFGQNIFPFHYGTLYRAIGTLPHQFTANLL